MPGSIIEPEERRRAGDPGSVGEVAAAEAEASEDGDGEPNPIEEPEETHGPGGGIPILGRLLGGRHPGGEAHEAADAEGAGGNPDGTQGKGEEMQREAPIRSTPLASASPPQPETKSEKPMEPQPRPESSPLAAVADPDAIDLNRASFEQLRDLGFSVIQATRVLTYRERESGFSSLDDLDGIPGMPGSFLREVKKKLTI